MHTKVWTIELPIPIHTAWDFFSRPENLNEITPKEMNFIIHSDIKGVKMYEGLFINYTVTPILNIPMAWTTEITHINELKYFVDEQRQGPYAIWHHEHHFEPLPSGFTKMTDILHYALPLGILGKWLNRIFVDTKIESIFEYRSQVLKSKFKT